MNMLDRIDAKAAAANCSWLTALIAEAALGELVEVERRFYVYIIEHATEADEAGEPVVVYVGKGAGKRDRHRQRSSNADISAMGKAGLLRRPRRIAEGLTESEAFDLEKETIALYGRADLGLGPLRNLTDGGAGTSNLAAASRAKISTTSRGRVVADDTRARLSAASTGRPVTAETTAKRLATLAATMADPDYIHHNTGRKHSPEVVARAKAARAAARLAPGFVDPTRGRKPVPEIVAKRRDAQLVTFGAAGYIHPGRGRPMPVDVIAKREATKAARRAAPDYVPHTLSASTIAKRTATRAANRAAPSTTTPIGNLETS